MIPVLVGARPPVHLLTSESDLVADLALQAEHQQSESHYDRSRA
jgi:hypothetical protein